MTLGSHLQGLLPYLFTESEKASREDRCCPHRADNETES